MYFSQALCAPRRETGNEIKREQVNAQQRSFIRFNERMRRAVALSPTALPRRDYRLMMMALHPDI